MIDMLARIHDRLGALIDAQVAAAGARPPRMAPAQRPYTAMDRAQRRAAWDKHHSIVARLLPHQQT